MTIRTKQLTSDNSKEIVTIEEAMEHSRITDSYDEMVVRSCLDAAHDLVEKWLNRKIYPSTFIGWVEEYRERISLPFPPIQSVTYVTCEDSNNETITLREGVDWKFDAITEQIRFLDVFTGYDNFQFEFSAGYQSESDVPKAVKHAIKMTFATLYENREDTVVGTQVNEVPMTARRVLASHKVRSQI